MAKAPPAPTPAAPVAPSASRSTKKLLIGLGLPQVQAATLASQAVQDPRWLEAILLLVFAAGAASALFGHLAALMQSDVKRGLAASTTAQMGFMLLGFTPTVVSANTYSAANGYSSAMFYVVTYVFTTLGTFGLILLLSRRGFEAEPDLPDEVLVAARLEDVVVLEPRRVRLQIAVALLMGLVVGVLEQVELDLRVRVERQPLVGGPGQRALEDVARVCERRAPVGHRDVAEHARSGCIGSEPRDDLVCIGIRYGQDIRFLNSAISLNCRPIECHAFFKSWLHIGELHFIKGRNSAIRARILCQ